jgi:hypothetical protein
MKQIILLLLLMSFASCVIHGQKYKHKSEAEIARMLPAQRVDEYAEEWAHHRYDVLDDYSGLVNKYIRRDGLKALPRINEIINEYDPTRSAGRRGRKGERYDAAWMLLDDFDTHVVRVRASEEGRRALDALERSVERMRAAGYGQKEQHDWKRHGRFDSVMDQLKEAKGVNRRDGWVKETFRLEYEIILSDVELLEFSNFLVANYPEYPSWSETKLIKDATQLNGTGDPVRLRILEKPERYYEAYMEFKKAKR